MPPLPLSSSLSRVTIQALDRKAAQLGVLLSQWSDIVGPRFGDISYPVKLGRSRAEQAGVTLYLAVPSAWSTEFSHELPTLKSRINAFFGHGAIRDIKLVPRIIRPAAIKRKAAVVPPEDLHRIETAVEAIENPRLRAALRGLGIALQTHGGKDRP